MDNIMFNLKDHSYWSRSISGENQKYCIVGVLILAVIVLGYLEVLLIIQYILSKSNQELQFKLELFVQLENQSQSVVQLKFGQNEKELITSLYSNRKSNRDSILQSLSVS